MNGDDFVPSLTMLGGETLILDNEESINEAKEFLIHAMKRGVNISIESFIEVDKEGKVKHVSGADEVFRLHDFQATKDGGVYIVKEYGAKQEPGAKKKPGAKRRRRINMVHARIQVLGPITGG